MINRVHYSSVAGADETRNVLVDMVRAAQSAIREQQPFGQDWSAREPAYIRKLHGMIAVNTVQPDLVCAGTC